MKTYPVSLPSIGPEEERAVLEVLRSGHLSLGPKLAEFEKNFAEAIGTRYACAVNSGTSGLHLCMIAAGIGSGDEVITTPFSFIASANCVLYVGATPVFVDVDPKTSNMDASRIEAAITDKTKAILVVHIFGQTCDMDAIMEIAKRRNLLVIEDACESVLASYKGKKAGTFGRSAVFAFYPNKQMTTGEGGMVVTDDERVYRLCKSLANQGRAENMQWLDHQYLGYNYRMDEMSAALGIEQLKKLPSFIASRKHIAAWYDEAFAGTEITTPFVHPDNDHTYFVYVVQLPERADRDKLIGLLKDEGVMSKPYLPSIHLFQFYRERFGFKDGDFPVSESVSRRSLALPIYVGLTQDDVREMVARVIKTLPQSYV
ncbi:MAG: DegT/DnrJ/EryC1/StrS family aminotransferase [Candidatus Uhrbacteria bacterium]|nr:DegT/DnrJ/EryC1/StrS family aminotransferase [Candidatus Uhrbacteria bacterium]